MVSETPLPQRFPWNISTAWLGVWSRGTGKEQNKENQMTHPVYRGSDTLQIQP